MNIGQIQQELITALLTIYPRGEAATIAAWVMEHYTGRTRMERLLDKSSEISTSTFSSIQVAREELLRHRPVQYVLGEAWFMGLKLSVNESVLIPRPETEELVGWLLNDSPVLAGSILDIGTGSGCIPISLKKQLPLSDISAIDVCNAALQTAIKNAASNHVTVDFTHFDFLDETKWTALPVYDTIISNPPYIPLAEKDKLDKNVTAWEPGTALFVADGDPLIFYKKIATFGKSHLVKGGKIFVETHQDYAMATQQLFDEKGFTTELRKDVNDNYRMLKCQAV
ncbi:MAG: peptide chain release factor N(5)-glutamine methyltransferase [Chitinophagaceae bacterium]